MIASLRALEAGEIVCVPGLLDGTAVDRIAAAESELRSTSSPAVSEPDLTRPLDEGRLR